MPEGPELHLAMLSINKICKYLRFSGKVYRSPVHKCSDIEWDQPAYTISAESRGKELLLHLKEGDDEIDNKCKSTSNTVRLKKTTSILFTFGMSGKFVLTPVQELQKHSHLTFFTKEDPKRALSFVDPRRFGKWIEGGHWSPDRGPCVIQEYNSFVNNIVANLGKTDFNKPICEIMLNQKYFSGIGNYLRAEILFRCHIPPFVKANSVLQLSDAVEVNISDSQKSEHVREKNKPTWKEEGDDLMESGNKVAASTHHENTSVKDEVVSQSDSDELICDMLTPQAQELLKLCHTVPLEVVHLGSSKYSLLDLTVKEEDQLFEHWLQCYGKAGMTNLQDHNKRTMWFCGPAGPLVPNEEKTRTFRRNKKTQEISTEETEEAVAEAVATPSDNSLPVEVLTVNGTSKRSTGRRKRSIQNSSTTQDSKDINEVVTEKLHSGYTKLQKKKDGIKARKKATIKVLAIDDVSSIRTTRSAVERRKV